MKTKVIAGAAAAIAIAGAGVAVGATQFGDPKAENEAVISDAASQLGIEPSRLSDALKKALQNRIDAAVAAGRITKERGDELKARIESGAVPFFGIGRGLGFGHVDHHPFGGLDAAADYLGLTRDQLHTELHSGKTLAQVAKDHGKSVDGLVDAMVADAKKHLDDAVAAGRLTQAQADEVLAGLEQRITDFVNNTGPRFFRGGPPHR